MATALPSKILVLNGTTLLHGRDWVDRGDGGYTLTDQNFVADSDSLQIIDLLNNTVQLAEDADVTNESSHGPGKKS